MIMIDWKKTSIFIMQENTLINICSILNSVYPFEDARIHSY